MHITIAVNSKFGRVINKTRFVPPEDLFPPKLLEEIKNALAKVTDKVTVAEADGTFNQKIMLLKPDYVYNLSYGLQGKYRQSHVPGILELLGIPYLASDPSGHAIALDKFFTKALVEKIGIPMPNGVLIRTKKDIKQIPNYKTGYIVKPNEDMNSNGLHFVKTRSEAIKKAAITLRKYRSCLVEEYIKGDDVTVGVIGTGSATKAFNPLRFKYEQDDQKIRIKMRKKSKISCECPAQLPKEVTKKLQNATVKIHNLLQLKDFSRSDFRFTSDNQIYFLEINSSPGLGPNSPYPFAATRSGIKSREELFIKLFKSMVKSNENRTLDTAKN